MYVHTYNKNVLLDSHLENRMELYKLTVLTIYVNSWNECLFWAEVPGVCVIIAINVEVLIKTL